MVIYWICNMQDRNHKTLILMPKNFSVEWMGNCQTSSFLSSPLFFILSGYTIDYHWNQMASWQNCLHRGHLFKFNSMKNEDKEWWNEIIFSFLSLDSDEVYNFFSEFKMCYSESVLFECEETFCSDFQFILAATRKSK